MMSKYYQSKSVAQETSLLKRIAEGDKLAFWELWSQYKDSLYNYCLRQMNNNAVDAQEALSISMLKAWDKLPNHAHKITNIKGWLIRLTQNVSIDFYRKRNRTLTSTDNLDFLSCFSPNYSSYFLDSPEKLLMREELKNILYQEIQKLDDSLKIPLIMRFIENKSYSEIANQLQLSQTNIRKRIQKVRRILIEKIKPYLQGCNNLKGWEKLNDNYQELLHLELDELLTTQPQILPIKEPNLEEIFYHLYTSHLETLASPVFIEELAYV
ncbi:MAG: RNA polymerase sigma factor [Crocosphaera sp.]